MSIQRLLGLRRTIFIDIGTCHAARAKTADDLTVQLDTDFRRELEDAFNKAEQALDRRAEPELVERVMKAIRQQPMGRGGFVFTYEQVRQGLLEALTASGAAPD